MIHKHSFGKQEHLCGEKRITRVFTQGEAFIAYPLRVVYVIEPKKDLLPASIMVSVPKKRFKRAVKRNLLKRRMREAYRLNKNELTEALNARGLQIHVAFNYVSDEVMEFDQIEKKMKVALLRLIEKLPALAVE
jgi:ribonuclease P protein component